MANLPHIDDYLQNLNLPITIAISVASILTVIIFAIFFVNLSSLISNTPKQFKTSTIFLCSIYQIVAIASFVAILIPRSIAVVETIQILTFGFAALIFHGLILKYVGGESNLIKKCPEDAFNLRVPPFCMMFCCGTSQPTKGKLLFVRILITQFPIVHGIMYLFFIIKFIEYPLAPNVYFIPIMVLSIVPVVWGLNIIVRMAGPVIPEYSLLQKYFAMQFVLLMCKIQPAIGDLVTGNAAALQELKVEFPMTVEAYKNVIVHTIILIEMVVLSLWAQKVYKMPRRTEAVNGYGTNISVIRM